MPQQYSEEQLAKARAVADKVAIREAEEKRLRAIEYKQGAAIREAVGAFLDETFGELTTKQVAEAVASLGFDVRVVFRVLLKGHKWEEMSGYWSRGPAVINKFGRKSRPFVWHARDK